MGHYYWSSSPYVGNPDIGWHVVFGDGNVSNSHRDAGYYVRLVRGNPAVTPSYTISDDGTEVTDNSTGLIWRRCSEGQTWDSGTNRCAGTATGYSYEQALGRAKSEATTSGKAWRVPNIKELSSIARKGQAVGPSIDSSAFPDTPPFLAFWSSSPNVGNPYGAWFVYFNYGYVGNGGYRFNDGYVRLVR